MSEALKKILAEDAFVAIEPGVAMPVPLSLQHAGPTLQLIDGDRNPAKPRSILIALHDFSLGGTERIAVRLANEWAKIGAAVTVFAGAAEGPLLAMLNPMVAIARPATPIMRGRGSQWRLAAAVARQIARDPVDGCFVPGNYHWPVAAVVSRLPLSIRPVVIAQISAALRKGQRGPIRQFLYDVRMRKLLGNVDATVALCDPARRQADHIIGARRTTTIMLPALDGGVARPSAPAAANQRIVAAGRLVPEKGFDTLIRAFALMTAGERNPAAELVIVGEGPDRVRLTALAIDLGVADRVYMPGYVPCIRPWLDASRLFVLSSRFEGFPAVMVEALAAGRPIVATDCTPATTELLPNFTAGRVVPIDDAAEMARAIAAMLAAAPSDPVRLAASVDGYRLEPVAQQYLDLLDRLDTARWASARV
jgi:glycosyltransferase involved in cell wall biosynthesis